MKSITEFLSTKVVNPVNVDDGFAGIIKSGEEHEDHEALSHLMDVMKDYYDNFPSKKMLDFVAQLVDDYGFKVLWAKDEYMYKALRKISSTFTENTRLIAFNSFYGQDCRDESLAIDIFDFSIFTEFSVILSTEENKLIVYELKNKDFDHFKKDVEDGSLEFDAPVWERLNEPGVKKGIRYILDRIK